jgi:signal transduction histidine kinase
MKRKALIWIGFLTVVLVACGAIVLHNLDKRNVVERISQQRLRMVDRYDRILFHMKDTQAELYSLASGFGENVDPLDDDLFQTKMLLTVSIGEFEEYRENNTCYGCHMAKGAESRQEEVLALVHHHDEELRAILDRVILYEHEIKRVVTAKKTEPTLPLLKKAVAVGNEIIERVSKVKGSTLAMITELGVLEKTMIRRAERSILVTIIIGIALAGVIITFFVLSVIRPLRTLVAGMSKVSSGDFNCKVDLTSHDEIGFLAQTFNTMTTSLKTLTEEKETLLNEMQELNSSLDKRIHEATEGLRNAHERILRQETLSAVGTFAAGVAHELSTPIASVINYFRMLKSRVAEEKAFAADIQLIEGELQRYSGILREMLFLAKAPEKEKIPTDVNAIVHQALALIRYQPEYKKTVRINEDIDPGLPMISAIPGQLRQIFLNFFVNALHAMPRGGDLSISTCLTPDREKVVITISDTGHGVPESDLEKIFLPFYTSRDSGSGLGLSVCLGIIRAHGGDVAVQSEVGKGTTFSIYFPAPEEPQHEQAGKGGEKARLVRKVGAGEGARLT